MRYRMHRIRAALALGAVGAVAAMTVATATGSRADMPLMPISIDYPAKGDVLRPGQVVIRGTVDPGTPSGTATVLYLADVSRSTAAPSRDACRGGGSHGAGGSADLNADGRAGTVLDCEIAALTRLHDRLRAVWRGRGDFLAGLVPFATRAVTADLSPAGGVQWLVPAGQALGTGGTGITDVELAARSLRPGEIGRYNRYLLGGRSDLGDAVQAGLNALRTAPTGPRWLVLLSDGDPGVRWSALNRLRAAARDEDVHLRSLAFAGAGGGVGCAGALTTLAAATGDRCVRGVVDDDVASRLAADVAASVHGQLKSITVVVDDNAVAADVGPDGRWTATLPLDAGDHTMMVTATVTGGGTYTIARRARVRPAEPAPPVR